MRVDPDGVAVLTLTNAPVNALHPEGERLSGFARCLEATAVPAPKP